MAENLPKPRDGLPKSSRRKREKVGGYEHEVKSTIVLVMGGSGYLCGFRAAKPGKKFSGKITESRSTMISQSYMESCSSLVDFTSCS